MPSASPYEHIGEIAEVSSVSEANDFLKSGWVLVKVVEKTLPDGSTAIVYIVGRQRSVRPEPLIKKAVVPEDEVKAALESLRWKKFREGQAGEWAFITTATGEILPELKPAAAIIEKLRNEGSEAEVGGYRYRVSKERFLNRVPAARLADAADA